MSVELEMCLYRRDCYSGCGRDVVLLAVVNEGAVLVNEGAVLVNEGAVLVLC